MDDDTMIEMLFEFDLAEHEMTLHRKALEELSELKEMLSAANTTLNITKEGTLRTPIKGEGFEMVLITERVDGILVGRGMISIIFEPGRNFGDVHFYDLPIQNEEDLVAVFIKWFGYSPHHRYHVATHEKENRSYCFDKNVSRAEYVMEDTKKQEYVYDLEVLA